MISSIIIVARPCIIEAWASDAATKRSAIGDVWKMRSAARSRAIARMRSTASRCLPPSSATPSSIE